MAKKLQYSLKEYQKALDTAISRYEQLKERQAAKWLESRATSKESYVFPEQLQLDQLIELRQVLRNLANVGTIDGSVNPVQLPLSLV